MNQVPRRSFHTDVISSWTDAVGYRLLMITLTGRGILAGRLPLTQDPHRPTRATGTPTSRCPPEDQANQPGEIMCSLHGFLCEMELSHHMYSHNIQR